MSSQRKADPAIQLPLFSQGEYNVDFCVRESSRARRLSIKVHADGRVEVVAPRRTRPADVQSFVARHREWIVNTSVEQRNRFPKQDRSLPARIDFSAVRQRWSVEYSSVPGQVWRSREREECLRLSGDTNQPRGAYDLLRRWLAKRGRQHLLPWLRELSSETGLIYETVQIRGQRTRWGSYSSSGTVSLNYCLLFLAPEIVRYLLIHELCHARHMNHSKRYWKLVERYEPDYRVLDRRLTDAWVDVPGWVFADK